MHSINRTIHCLLAAALAISSIAAVTAQAPEDEIGPCPEGEVSGTVVAVDEETGLVTLDTGEGGLCTVTVGGEFDHPIISLLGAFFGEVSAANLAAALEATSVWVVCDDTGACELASEDDEGAQLATVLSVTEEDDGTFTLELSLEGQEDPVTVTTDDADLAADLSAALETLNVEWTLQADEDGQTSVVDAGDQIAQLHEDGLGFGVIVKLFAIASESQEACEEEETDPAETEPCGVTVEELVEAFQSGMGMGQLFKEFGKPSMLGVGHVRQALKAGEEDEAGSDAAGLTGAPHGICNAREHGGQANAHGHGAVNCGDAGQSGSGEQTEQNNQTAGGKGNGNSGNSGNGGGNGNGDKGSGNGKGDKGNGNGKGDKGNGNGKGGRP